MTRWSFTILVGSRATMRCSGSREECEVQAANLYHWRILKPKVGTVMFTYTVSPRGDVVVYKSSDLT
jgi:hypothetical protein